MPVSSCIVFAAVPDYSFLALSCCPDFLAGGLNPVRGNRPFPFQLAFGPGLQQNNRKQLERTPVCAHYLSLLSTIWIICYWCLDFPVMRTKGRCRSSRTGFKKQQFWEGPCPRPGSGRREVWSLLLCCLLKEHLWLQAVCDERLKPRRGSWTPGWANRTDQIVSVPHFTVVSATNLRKRSSQGLSYKTRIIQGG